MVEFVIRQKGAISWGDLWAKQDAWRERKLKLKEKEEEKEENAGSDTIMGEADTLGVYLPYWKITRGTGLGGGVGFCEGG